MTDSEWQTSTDIRSMITYGGKNGVISSRQFQLFRAACYRKIRGSLNEEHNRAAIYALEDYTEGLIIRQVLREQHWCKLNNVISKYYCLHQASKANQDENRYYIEEQYDNARLVYTTTEIPYYEGIEYEISKTLDLASEYQRRISNDLVQPRHYPAVCQHGYRDEGCERTQQAAQVILCNILREITGHTLQRPSFCHDWNTMRVRQLAQEIVTHRNYSLMPSLVDLLIEEECDDGAVLNHCCSQGHVLGCWLLDGLRNVK